MLEVILASLLIAVLMIAVYQTLSIYRKLFEKGETQTEEIQLTRTLSQQLSDDLVGAIQDPVFIDPKSRGPSGARRFGLFGTDSELRIDVLQIPAFQVAPTPTAQEMEDTTKPRVLQAPELRTIYYSFYGSISVDSALPDARVGLTRRELDFETPEVLDKAELTGLTDVSLAQEVPVKEPETIAVRSTFDQLLEVGMDSSVMWAPEVVALQFRYFDGSSWRNAWDSLARNGLPVAVEMTIGVASLEDADAIRRATTGLVAAAESGRSSPGQEATALPARSKLPQPRVHRVVIHLPNSPLIRERAAVKRRAAPTLAAPAPLPKVILQRAQPKQKTQRISPDQWMRNE